MPNYDSRFFDYVNSSAIRSAEEIVPLIKNTMNINSVLDVGCGQGAWLQVWQKNNTEIIHGIDGAYVDQNRLLIDPAFFTAHDLTNSFDLQKQFDLVQSLEVAEHLPASSAGPLIASLIQHSDIILFSAAPKGQGGDHHINEQPYDYWRALFARHNFIAIDFLRPQILHNKNIEVWYRYNPILYVAAAAFDDLPEGIKQCRVPDDAHIPDLSPVLYKFRKAIIRCLPVPIMTILAKIKERIAQKH